MIDQPAVLMTGQTHGPTVAGAVEDYSPPGDPMSSAGLDAKGGEPSEGIRMEDGQAWEDDYPQRPAGGSSMDCK